MHRTKKTKPISINKKNRNLATPVAATAMPPQTQTTTSSTTTYLETSKLVGKPVRSSQGEEIGTIKDVVIDRNTGCMAYTVLSTGGGGGRVAGGGGKMVAVPWSVYSPQSDLNTYTVTVERERIFNAPASITPGLKNIPGLTTSTTSTAIMGSTTGEKTKGSTRERSRSREATPPPERPQE